MSDHLDTEKTTKPRSYALAMLLASIPVAVIGVTFIVNAAGWWSYATGTIALVGAALLIRFGVPGLSRPSK